MAPRLLILGGTTEAIALTRAFLSPDWAGRLEVRLSLAGRTQASAAIASQFPVGVVRVGGFGGVAGLREYLQREAIAMVLDATHPFAAQMSHHAALACLALESQTGFPRGGPRGLPRAMLLRPAWIPAAGDRWISVPDHATAALTIPSWGKRIFLTIGRQELAAYTTLEGCWCLMRMIDPPSPPYPLGDIVLDRGPFDLAQERELLSHHRIDVIVSKNSGGEATAAKLVAARELGLPVIMVERPCYPDLPRLASVEEAIAWVGGYLNDP